MRRFGRLLWPAGAVLGVAAELVAYGWSDPLKWIPDLLVGWGFIALGLIAAAQQPNRRSGALMVATGFTWFVGNFAGAEAGLLSWLGASGIYLHRGPLVHLILAYPSGRLRSRTARVVVGVGYAAALLPPVWDGVVATFVVSALVVGVAVGEYGAAVGRERRARVVSVWAAAGLAFVLAGGSVARLALPPGDTSGPWLLVYQAVLAAIAGSLFAGLVSTSWQRPDITDLVVELGAADSGTLRAELSRALGDPSLEIGYWRADAEAFVDAEGRVLSPPDPASGRAVTMVERESTPVAAIAHDPAVLDDPGLREAVASAAQLAASNARLQAEVQGRIVELAASRRRILDARDEERRRLERQLHDRVELRLRDLHKLLRVSRESAKGEKTKARLAAAEQQLTETLGDLGRLGRGLHPRILSEQGLERALASLAEGVPVPVELNVATGVMPPALETAAYFVCAEALANATKHASASKVTVAVTADDDAIKVVVEDDGVGGADAARGSGLRGMADRIAALGGTFTVDSVRGTRITAEIPLGGEAR